MKFILTFCFFSSLAFADNVCIQTKLNNKMELVCANGISNVPTSDICNPNTQKCFIGNASELVSKINYGYFRNSDDGLFEASFINEDTIGTSYGGLDPISCEIVIKNCEMKIE